MSHLTQPGQFISERQDVLVGIFQKRNMCCIKGLERIRKYLKDVECVYVLESGAGDGA